VREEGLKRGSPEIVANAAHNLGFTYVQAHQPERAIPFLTESISVSLKEGDVVQKQKSVKELARAYEEMGQYDKALSVIKEYINTMDSLVALQGAQSSANLELNEEFLRQEGRIQKLIASQKEKENDIKRQRYILWGLSLALLLFAGLIYMLIRNIRQKQRANMQIKLQSLRAQMNPHFIFNSLNSVNNFISKNDERSANKYLSDFSRLMRTVLSNSDQDFVSLETEVDTMRIYLELEHFRFGEKFDYQLEIADDIDPEIIRVPPMLIQPYIENAIWHGLRYKEDKGILNVRIFTENNLLYCTVKDNGIGRKKSAELKTNHQKTYQSTGIKNTKERIDLLNKMHGTRLSVSILDLEENGNAAGTLVKISVPYILQNEEI
jgi:LytS/YehU family sensor histidine kinase